MKRKSNPLSAKGKAILVFVEAYQAKRGYAPAARDIQSALKLSSTAVVQYQLGNLEKAGLVQRECFIARSLRLTEAGKRIASEVATS